MLSRGRCKRRLEPMAPHRSRRDSSLDIALRRVEAGLLAAAPASPLHAKAFGSEGHHLVAIIAE